MRIKLLFLFFSVLFFLSCSQEGIEEVVAPTTTMEVVDAEIQGHGEEISEEPSPVVLRAQNWLAQIQQPNGLLESSENTNFVSLYDNALAALIFTSQGDLERAERIFDFFDLRREAELLQGHGGFFQFRDAAGENGNRSWMGDNVWLLIALNNYHTYTGNQRYSPLAQELETWIRSLQDEDGGLWGGYNADGTRIPKVTEGIITAFNAVAGYDAFHKNILAYLKQQRWDIEAKTLIASPETPAYNFALDLHSLGYSILKDFPEDVLLMADRYRTTQTATVTGEEISGYCFDEDKDVIWLEGTAQMAFAFQLAGMPSVSDELLAEIEKTFITSVSLEASSGIPYTTNQGTTYGATRLWDHADLTPALSSNAWYLFTKLNFDPFELQREKEIPPSDKFWLLEATD
ncbi:hypothetical protein WIW50_03095 [Flavobacteriaceae bacterium 3-367]